MRQSNAAFVTLWFCCDTVDSWAVIWWKATEMSLGHFRVLWWFMAPSETWQLPLMAAEPCELCSIRRDEYPHACVWVRISSVNVIFPREGAGEDIGTTKNTIPPCRLCFLSNFSFIWLKIVSCGECSPPLSYADQRFCRHTPKTHLLPTGMCKHGPSKATCCICKWLMFLSH